MTWQQAPQPRLQALPEAADGRRRPALGQRLAVLWPIRWRRPQEERSRAEERPEGEGSAGWRHWAAPLLLLVLPFAVYARFLFGAELYNPDVFLAYRPAHAWLAEGLRRGELPLWNRNLLGGFPLAFTEYGWFSPLSWLPLWLFGGHAGYYAAVALYVALAALAAFGLARAWGYGRVAALLAALVYSQSLFVIGGAPLLNQGAAYWTLPALLWSARAHFGGARLAAPTAGVIVALQLLGSHPQLALIAAFPAALYALGLAGAHRSGRPLIALAAGVALGVAASAVRFLPTLALAAASERAAGLSLAASAAGAATPAALLAGLLFPSASIPRVVTPQWSLYLGPLPLILAGLALKARWRRHQWAPEMALLAALGLAGLLLALGSSTPLYRLALAAPLLGYFREPTRFLLWTVIALAFLSADGLAVALAQAATAVGARRRGVLAGGALVAVVAAFMLAHAGLRAAEPRILQAGLERALARLLASRDYPVDYYVNSVQAAWREALRATDVRDPGLLIPLLAIAAAGAWWAVGRGAKGSPWTAVAATALPLLLYGQVRLPAIPASVVRDRPASLDIIQSERTGAAESEGRSTPEGSAPVYRVLSWLPLAADYEVRLAGEAAGRPTAAVDRSSYRLLAQSLAPNFGVAFDLPEVDGYENLMTHGQAVLAAALGSERATFQGPPALAQLGLDERRRRFGERWGLFAAAGGAVLLTTERMQPATWPGGVEYEPRAVPALDGAPPLTIYRLAHPLPRAYVATTWTVVDSPEAAARALIARPFEQGDLPAVIEAPPESTLPAPRPQPAAGAGQELSPVMAEARIVRDDEREVVIETNADHEAMLVLLDAQAPGWTAMVTGRPVPILTANVAFRAVVVPPGRQRVVFHYTPPHWEPALWITGLAAAALVGWLSWAWRASRAASRPAPER